MTLEKQQALANLVIFIGVVIGGLGAYYSSILSGKIQERDSKVQEQKEEAVKAVDGKKAALNAYAGVLKPNQKVIFSSKYPNDLIDMEIGESGVFYNFKYFREQAISGFLTENNLAIIKDKGQIKISSTFRDRTGMIVAEILDNEWKLNKNNLFDRNYSKDALEVKDNTGEIIFQVKLLKNIVRIQGKFYDSDGKHLILAQKLPKGTGALIAFNRSLPEKQAIVNIIPLFKYPSDFHLGELVSK